MDFKRFLSILFLSLFCVSVFAATYKYKGKIGQYDVKVTLTTYNETVRPGFGTANDIKGSYTYTATGSTLQLKGSDLTMTGLTNLAEYIKP